MTFLRNRCVRFTENSFRTVRNVDTCRSTTIRSAKINRTQKSCCKTQRFQKNRPSRETPKIGLLRRTQKVCEFIDLQIVNVFRHLQLQCVFFHQVHTCLTKISLRCSTLCDRKLTPRRRQYSCFPGKVPSSWVWVEIC